MRYHLLLVDDEIHAIEGLKADLDLDKLGISRLFVAHNVKQAKEWFETERIDIMLCDIEMPEGSGLELLSWVREAQYKTVTMFLTSHADFKYAKEALSLGSLDYLLKPVLSDHLEQAIRKAQKEIDRNSEIDKISQSHQLWKKHHSLIIERFWIDLINHSIPSNKLAIRTQIDHNQLPITEETVFLPVLISVQSWKKELNRRDEKIMEYALKNYAQEIIIQNDTNGLFFFIDRGMLLGVMTTGTSMELDSSWISKTFEQYIESCNHYFFCDVSCYIGQPVEAHQMADMVALLRQKDKNNVAFTNKLFFFDTEEELKQDIVMPKLNFWISILKTGDKEAVIQEVENFLGQLVQNQTIDVKLFRQFHQDFMQSLYFYLNVEGIQAHHLFGDEQSLLLSQKAGLSVRDMLNWTYHSVNKAMDHVKIVEQSDSVVQTVQRYIAQYIGQELSRESIAEMVFLNPDHLSRLFKKETGYSISDYILMERIKLSKELLTQTNIPISAIATSVGHTNFSHFAKIFKKYTGLGPTEYRNQYTNTD